MTDQLLHTDKELFDQIALDSHDAFKTLLERHRSNVFGHAMAFLKDAYKAQDVVQEVFLSIWNARHKLPEVKNPESFLFIMARNKIVTEFRKNILQPVREITHQNEATADPSPDLLVEGKEIILLIQRAVEQLPPQRKLIFELGKKEGLKYEEIAARLNISPNTVKVQMVQALSFIRNFIRNQVTILVLLSALM